MSAARSAVEPDSGSVPQLWNTACRQIPIVPPGVPSPPSCRAPSTPSTIEPCCASLSTDAPYRRDSGISGTFGWEVQSP